MIFAPSSVGRYFICECKDWDEPADVTAVAKFVQVLRTAKCTFGILFSRDGISGKNRFRDSERLLVQTYQADGVVMAVVTMSDLERVVSGGNFITMLRSKYEEVRLDLQRRAAH